MEISLLKNPFFILKQLQRDLFRKYAKHFSGIILDIGCGQKPYERLIENKIKYIGMDSVAFSQNDLRGDVTRLPFQDKSVDTALCLEVLEHLPDSEVCLKEIERVVKKGGYIYITVPMSWPLHYEPHDYFRFTNHGLTYLMKKFKFEILSIERIGGIFSLVGARMSDVFFELSKKYFFPFLSLRNRERLAVIFISPCSLVFYLLGLWFDNIDQRDAIGWAVLLKRI